jgi:hypothetical protein
MSANDWWVISERITDNTIPLWLKEKEEKDKQ